MQRDITDKVSVGQNLKTFDDSQGFAFVNYLADFDSMLEKLDKLPIFV